MASLLDPVVVARLNRAVDYIEANLETDLTLLDVAQEAGYARCYFAGLFAAWRGETFGTFATRLRLEVGS